MLKLRTIAVNKCLMKQMGGLMGRKFRDHNKNISLKICYLRTAGKKVYKILLN